MHEVTNSPNESAGTERNLEDDGVPANENGVINGASSEKGAGTIGKAEYDEDSAIKHSNRKRKLSHSEGQKVLSTQRTTSSPVVMTRSDSSSAKRKFEDDEDSVGGNSFTGRRIFPQSGS